jgi:hypothetical protein
MQLMKLAEGKVKLNKFFELGHFDSVLYDTEP